MHRKLRLRVQLAGGRRDVSERHVIVSDAPRNRWCRQVHVMPTPVADAQLVWRCRLGTRRPTCGRARAGCGAAVCAADAVARDWRKAKPIAPGSAYPAKEHCSQVRGKPLGGLGTVTDSCLVALLQCGLCDTYYVAHVKDACAFLGEGNGRLPQLEARVHGRPRRLDGDELFFGVHEAMYNVRATAMPGAQWTGVVTTVAVEALRSGLVDAVACVGSHPDDPLKPVPMLALTPEAVLASRGVKPMLSPSLNVLAEIEARAIKRVLFIAVGCAVQALRGVEQHLGLEKLYVMGTNCTDNGRESGLRKFLTAVSDEPATAVAYEFMADYRVHIKHTTQDGALRYEKIPYFCLPADELSQGVRVSPAVDLDAHRRLLTAAC